MAKSDLDEDDLPFAEWSDALINKETWDAVKDHKSKSNKKGMFEDVTNNAFHDNQLMILPANIIARKWPKVTEVFQNVILKLLFFYLFYFYL